jgi:hypothetical protein
MIVALIKQIHDAVTVCGHAKVLILYACNSSLMCYKYKIL